jgi:hypothetical protein
MEQEEYYRLTERLREIEVELAMNDAGWGPYLEDIKKEKLKIVEKLNTTPWYSDGVELEKTPWKKP